MNLCAIVHILALFTDSVQETGTNNNNKKEECKENPTNTTEESLEWISTYKTFKVKNK